MAIIRTCHNKNNPCILLKKEIFLCSNLSLSARGLYGVLESLDEGEGDFHFLMNLLDLSSEKLSHLLAELADVGVIE